jgi:hypothetical protein
MRFVRPRIIEDVLNLVFWTLLEYFLVGVASSLGEAAATWLKDRIDRWREAKTPDRKSRGRGKKKPQRKKPTPPEDPPTPTPAHVPLP